MVYKGSYNATTGFPALGTADASNLGHYYVVTDAGFNPVALDIVSGLDDLRWYKLDKSSQ